MGESEEQIKYNLTWHFGQNGGA